MKHYMGHQNGFAAIAAIFLVVILAALGGFMLTFSNSQQLTSAKDVQGSRAYWAARAGLEWAIVALPASPALCVKPVAAPPTPIDGFTITINCSVATYTDTGITPGVSPQIFLITSIANSAGSPGTVGYIERSVSASVER